MSTALESSPVLTVNAELLALGQQLELHGSLPYVVTDRLKSYNGPAMLIFQSHILRSVIAPPGTRVGPDFDDTNLEQWRVQPAKLDPKAPEGNNVVSLEAIFAALPGEIADWADRVPLHDVILTRLLTRFRGQEVNLRATSGNTTTGELVGRLSFCPGVVELQSTRVDRLQRRIRSRAWVPAGSISRIEIPIA